MKHEMPTVSLSRTVLAPDWLQNWSQLENSKPIPLISFFTGAGFLDLGFELEGFEGVWHNENDEWFARAFENGLSGVLQKQRMIECRESIVDVGPSGIIRAVFGDRVNRKRTFGETNIFGVIGGPPCPDFSIGGKNRGECGDNGRLTHIYVDRICDLRPTFFVLENVKGLARTLRHREFLDRMLHRLELEGRFRVDVAVLNAIDFGVPQDRERIFVVGVLEPWLRRQSRKIEVGARGWFPWPLVEQYNGAKARYRWPTVDRFGSNPLPPPDIPIELTVSHAIGNTHDLACLPNGTEGFVAYSDKFKQVGEGDTSRKSFKRLHRWRFSPTAAYGNNEVHLHPFLPRRITVREAMRIQSAPDSYHLPGDMPLSKKFKIIGNAVPVTLARAVAASMASFLKGVSNG